MARLPLRVFGLAAGVLWLWLARTELWPHHHAPTLPWLALALLGGGALGSLLALAYERLPPAWRGPRAYGALLALLSAGSVALTAWYQLGPLRARLASRDGCVYLLQARALSHGHWGMPTAQPLSAYAAHFLFLGADGRLHGIFAPGYPLFLVPFVWLGRPLWAGCVAAALVVLSTWSLARALHATRPTALLAVALSLAPFVRTSETAELLSHALVGSLSAWAFALAVGARRGTRWPVGVALGLCLGEVAAARMLDGLVLGAVLGPYLLARVFRRQLSWRVLAVALACALPFAGLLAWQQRVSTGSYTTAPSIQYVRNADWPPNCLKLGFGREVGCSIEHVDEVRAFGPDGYTPDDGLLLIRHRTSQLGPDLTGIGALLGLCFLAVALAPSGPRALAALYPLALTGAYGLFYYGNHPLWGARHLYPAAPFLHALLALCVGALPWLRRRPRWAAALGVALLALVGVGQREQWRAGLALTRDMQRHREDLLGMVRRQGITRGLVITRDSQAWLQSFDPWRDGPNLLLLHDDRSGMLDTRRFHPELPVYLSQGDHGVLERLELPPLPRGLLLEFERGWPAYQRVNRCAASPVSTGDCCRGMQASGGALVHVRHAGVGATYELPFDLASSGTWLLRLDGVAGPWVGRWHLRVDDVDLGDWEGYAPALAPLRRDWGPVRLRAGRHVFHAECVGRAPEAASFDAGWDALYALPLGVEP